MKFSVKKMSPKYLHLLWMIIGIACFSHAQSARFYLQTDRTTVAQGETFVLEAILENIESKSIQIPDVAPFKIVQGPSTSTSISIINGKRSGTISHQYILLATTKGSHKIPPATSKVGTKTIKSNDLTITVTSAKASNISTPDAKGETFIRLEIPNEKVYIGQQVPLNYVLYTRQNIESYNVLNEPKFEGFYVQPINDIRDQPQRKTVNGKEYHSQVIRRSVLFPQKTGTFNVDPLNITLDIPVENGRSSIFFRETRKENISTNRLKIKVLDLPKNAPISFSGAVGNYEMKANILKTNVSTGEAIVLQMQVEGDGDPKIVVAPDFDVPSNFEKYEPSTTKDETYTKGDKIQVLKVFEYIFVPKKDSIYVLQPEFTFLSTISGKYETLTSGPYTINVNKGNSSATPIDDTKELKFDNQELVQVTPLHSNTDSPWASVWYIGSIFFILLLTFLGIIYKRSKMKERLQANDNLKKAVSIARVNLAKALEYKNQGEPALFYEEIAQATTGYILKKYKIPNLKSSAADVVSYFDEKGISKSISEKYLGIQRNCELARFAGKFDDMNGIYTDAEWMINALEDIK